MELKKQKCDFDDVCAFGYNPKLHYAPDSTLFESTSFMTHGRNKGKVIVCGEHTDEHGKYPDLRGAVFKVPDDTIAFICSGNGSNYTWTSFNGPVFTAGRKEGPNRITYKEGEFADAQVRSFLDVHSSLANTKLPPCMTADTFRAKFLQQHCKPKSDSHNYQYEGTSSDPSLLHASTSAGTERSMSTEPTVTATDGHPTHSSHQAPVSKAADGTYHLTGPIHMNGATFGSINFGQGIVGGQHFGVESHGGTYTFGGDDEGFKVERRTQD